MVQKIVDLHIHSKYSRACSPQLELPKIADACVKKGIDICATGDYTHPGWLKHIKEHLEEVGKSGLYRLKSQISNHKFQINSKFQILNPTRFILSTEVACIYRHKDKTRRLHHVILAPSIVSVEKLIERLEKLGKNLRADGRPILGMSSQELLKILMDIDPRFYLIPAHAWTPWFAIFGSKSGYDSIAECFDELSPYVRTIETGLSSDPTMNHRLSQLDHITLVSNSDAHSLENLGREANVLNFADEKDVNYDELVRIVREGDKKKFLYTIEFYPEEGMYHVDGHRACSVSMLPAETKKLKKICPKCKKELTVGVLHRVDDLADRSEKDILAKKFIPHKYIVPLREIIASVFEVGKGSKKVEKEYNQMIASLGSEFAILLRYDIWKIQKAVSEPDIAIAIANMRVGKVEVAPGFDGQYGVVKAIFDKNHQPKQSRLI
ncbi:MAG: endonuclease Q family protein [Candidatus Magasanikbacteria bacterium]